MKTKKKYFKFCNSDIIHIIKEPDKREFATYAECGFGDFPSEKNKFTEIKGRLCKRCIKSFLKTHSEEELFMELI